MKISDLLKGKMVNFMTDAKVVVQLEIESQQKLKLKHETKFLLK